MELQSLKYQKSFLIKTFLSKFINSISRRGRKKFAFNFFLDVKFLLKVEEINDVSLYTIKKGLQLIPSVFLVKARQGANIKWLPMPIRFGKKVVFILKWIFLLLKKKSKTGNLTPDILKKNLFGLSIKKGDAYTYKKKYLITALSNRHFLNILK